MVEEPIATQHIKLRRTISKISKIKSNRQVFLVFFYVLFDIFAHTNAQAAVFWRCLAPRLYLIALTYVRNDVVAAFRLHGKLRFKTERTKNKRIRNEMKEYKKVHINQFLGSDGSISCGFFLQPMCKKSQKRMMAFKKCSASCRRERLLFSRCVDFKIMTNNKNPTVICMPF